ncbi:uncharacterized protein LOC107272954 isoform X1 [Cephus cinctus]|uniref:Uncharacterized protein LOC107272954 isoform X1 n=1 Tax=Cephus cinctus TaxID=211228 RepID=A0AAJ7CAU5_CEPCN|nr:uncharacterized protein LOC107272954 isoform X1 [Cephus cinctus]
MASQKAEKSILKSRLEDAQKIILRLEEELRLLKLENENLKQITGKIVTASPNVNIKGCTCKGNCSNKICGCVKKNNHCGPLCKCNNVSCRNQLQENENIHEKYNILEESSTKIPKHSADGQIKNKHSNILKEIENGQLHDKHLEQVKTSRSIFSPDCETDNSVKYDNYEMEDMIRFNDVRVTLHFDSTVQTDVEDVNKPKETRNTRKKKYSKKERSYEENSTLTPSLPENTNRKKRSKPIEINTTENGNFKENPSKKDANLKEGGPQKNSKIFKKLLNTTPATRRVRNKTKHTEKSEGVKVISTADENDVSKNITQNKKPKTKIEAERSPGESAYSSAEEQNILVRSNSQLDKSFNPMKPRHQLLRSPAGSINYSRTVNESDTPTDSQAMENIGEFPPPLDINEPEVDWEKHKAELVQCKLCKRKFFPHRIKKHELNCKQT